MPENSTPEEKLLKVIEGASLSAKKHKAKDAPAYVPTLNDILLSTGMVDSGKYYFLFANIKKINLGLGIFCCFVFLAVIADYNLSIKSYKKKADALAPDGLFAKTFSAEDITYSKDNLSIEGKKHLRYIFDFNRPPKVTPQADANEEADKFFSSLTLVGIIWTEGAAQVMVEDVQKGKTMLLREGDEFDGAVVDKITRDRVIFKYKGSMHELE